MASSQLDRINQAIWSRPDVVEEFETFEGWLDRGERAALVAVASRVRGQPILDIGVGGGRTTSLLRLLSDSYVGVDYSSEMVASCRQAYPGVDIRLADARDLQEFADASFALAVFSNNGLDAVDHQDRARIIAEVYRVLRPGGLFVVSSLNKEGWSCGERPWQLHRPHETWHFDLKGILRGAAAVTLGPGRYVRSWRNYWRLRGQAEDHGSWSLAPLAAHDFGLLVHFTSVAALRSELTGAGFHVELIVGNDGHRIAADPVGVHVDYMHAIAERLGVESVG